MPTDHARLSPSSAERWISCPASVRLAAAVPNESSSYAEEGTAAHTLAELRARCEILGQDADLYAWEHAARAAGYDVDEMHEHVDGYVAYLRERLKAAGPGAQLLLEVRVQTGVPMSWGTSDAVIVSETALEVVDFKYGAGVPVSPYENPQLMLYGVGALEGVGDILGDIETVRMTIVQPRAGAGEPRSFEMATVDLRSWRDSILPVAAEGLAGSDRFGPGEAACRWCPVKAECRARTRWATAHDFASDPDLLSPAEIGELLGDLPGIRAWLSDVEAAALVAAHDRGTEIPGWKVVLSGGQRKVIDEEAAMEKLLDLGIRPRDVQTPSKLVGITALDKVLKPFGGVGNVLAGLVQKTPGRPSLVRESDPRPAHDADAAAAREFAP